MKTLSNWVLWETASHKYLALRSFNGHQVKTTTPIVSIEGRVVRTMSGSVYELGTHYQGPEQDAAQIARIAAHEPKAPASVAEYKRAKKTEAK